MMTPQRKVHVAARLGMAMAIAGLTLVSGVAVAAPQHDSQLTPQPDPTADFSIVKGQVHAQTDFPEVVKIQTLIPGGIGGDCGGTIIDDRWVLSAGHCFSPSLKATVAITAYTPFGAAIDGKTYPVQYQAKTVYIHPRYANTRDGLPYDIALIELETPISSGVPRDANGTVLARDPKVTPYVPVVDLARNSDPLPREGMAQVVGRGASGFTVLEEGGRRFGRHTGDLTELRSAAVPFKPTCASSVMVCANDTEDYTTLGDLPPKDRHDPERHRHPATCVGDSGGPIFREVNGKRQQVGLVSHARASVKEQRFWEGDVCGRVQTNFSSVTYLRPWIDAVMADPPALGQAIPDPELPLPSVSTGPAPVAPNNPAGQRQVTPYVPALGDTRSVLATLPNPRGRAVAWPIRPVTHSDGSELAIGVNQLRTGLTPTAKARTIALLASETAHADALASGVLQRDADLYLTDPTHLERPVGNALQARGYSEVWILGGPQAVSPAVESAVAASGVKVRRIAGADRTQTAAAIAAIAQERAGHAPNTTYIARAFGDAEHETRAWADAIAIGGLAARTGNPIRLSATEQLSDAVRRALPARASTTVIGGPGAVSPAVLAALQSVTGRTPARIAGSNRADTAVQISQAYTDPKRAIVIDGYGKESWLLGFSLAGLAHDLNAPILLANGDALTPETLRRLEQLRPAQTICIGAPGLCADVQRATRR